MISFDDAKVLLENGNTCVLFSGDKLTTFTERGIKPLMTVIAKNMDVSGYFMADKIVGKAVAYLAAKADIKEVYAEVLSIAGAETLDKYKIKYSYKTFTDKIINREGTGICPMEDTVKDIDNFEEAYVALKNKLESLKG